MNTDIRFSGLPAPLVPAADPVDGLLHISHIEKGVSVEIQLWDDARSGDSIQLIWNEVLIGEALTVSGIEEPGDMLTLPLAPEHLQVQGEHQLGFRALNPNNGVSIDSLTTPIVIDRTPPGAAVLAPLLVPEVALGKTRTVILPGYAGMAVGDVIQTLCNGTEGPCVIVQAEHLADTPVTIQFERSLLQTFDCGKVTVTYQVTDRAGNVSRTSYSLELAL
ncbi:MAG: hypothetical protein ACOH2R_11275 [Pseudomonas sp.]